LTNIVVVGRRQSPARKLFRVGSIRNLLVWRIFLTLVWGDVSFAATVTLPSASVSSVTATSPVVRSTGAIAVSAVVAVTFYANTGPSITTTCDACKANNNYCNSGNSAVKSLQTVTSTSTTVGNMSTIVNASPEFGSANPTIARLDGPGLSGDGSGSFTGALPPPTAGADGIHTITVTAYVSENVTTSTTVTTSYMSGDKCGGTVLDSKSATTPPVTVTKFGSGSATGTYILNINPPSLSIQTDSAQPQITQGGDHILHNVLAGGAERTNYTVVNTVTGPAGYISSATGTGAFGPSTPSGTGIAGREHDTVGVHIACDAPLGIYSATSTANTVDLLSFPFDPVVSTNTAQFDVNPGLFLKDQTTIVSELPPDGDYAPMSCFSSTQGPRNIINTSPGSLHISATVNTTGPCAGFSNITRTSVRLDLPVYFSYLDSGSSPKAHIFIGPAAAGFDLHNPVTLKEVTAMIPKADIVDSGVTLTVDLSHLDLGLGPGVIPSSNTIYVRAHVGYSGTALPAEGTPYSFRTTTSATSPRMGSVTDSSYKTVYANSACVSGSY
jgi:hypothetical protein